MNRPKSALTLTKRVQRQRPQSSYKRQQILFPNKISQPHYDYYFATQAQFDDFNQLKFSKGIQRYKNKAYSTTRGLFYNNDLNKSQSSYGALLLKSKRSSLKKENIRMSSVLKPCTRINKKSIKQLKNSLDIIKRQTNNINDFINNYLKKSKNIKTNVSQPNQLITSQSKLNFNGERILNDVSNTFNNKLKKQNFKKKRHHDSTQSIFSVKGNKYIEGRSSRQKKDSINFKQN